MVELNTLDIEEIQRKYREERDKRIRPDGAAQYVDPSGVLHELAEDPYAEPLVRNPISDDCDVVVIGGGLSGLLTSARLKQAGINSVRVVEKGGDFGGTWYWNRYPGIRCDVESYVYMPLLEEVGTVPTEKYASGDEIFAHCQAIGRHFDLYEGALFQSAVAAMTWSVNLGRWLVKTDRGDELRARFVVVGPGTLDRPKLPGIPGLTEFKGKIFHTSRWDYDYTGGNARGGLIGLADKRVALIGSGATAVQVVPQVADSAKHLFVFQRTPGAVDLRHNRLTDVQWFMSQESGWQRRRMDNFLGILIGTVEDQDLVQDNWTRIGKMMTAARTSLEKQNDANVDATQLVDFKHMASLRDLVDQTIKNPAAREALKPWYNLFCKRPLFSDEYLATFNRSNVTLVDTGGAGVERLTENAIVSGGMSYEVDCIILATGFKAGVNAYESGGYTVTGKGGVSLADRWESGVRSLHGCQTAYFPNFFIVGALSQATVSWNFPHAMGEQARHAASMVAYCIQNDIKAIEVTEDAEERWEEEMKQKSVDLKQFESECTPGYFNNEGKTTGKPSLFGAVYGGGPYAFFEILEKWRDGGFRDDVRITPLGNLGIGTLAT